MNGGHHGMVQFIENQNYIFSMNHLSAFRLQQWTCFGDGKADCLQSDNLNTLKACLWLPTAVTITLNKSYASL